MFKLFYQDQQGVEFDVFFADWLTVCIAFNQQRRGVVRRWNRLEDPNGKLVAQSPEEIRKVTLQTFMETS